MSPFESSEKKGATLTWKDPRTGEKQFFRFDGITSESYESAMAITSHAVEVGSNVTDHGRLEHKVVTLEGFVSNTPIPGNPGHEDLYTQKSVPLKIPSTGASARGVGQFVQNAIGEALHPLPTSYTAFTPNGEIPNRIRLALETLLLAQSQRVLVLVAARDWDLDNCLISRISAPRTPEDGSVTAFTVELTQVRIVHSREVNTPLPTELRGEPNQNFGTRTVKDGDPKKAEQQTSLLGEFFGVGK
jgi:hypothetical protein